MSVSFRIQFCNQGHRAVNHLLWLGADFFLRCRMADAENGDVDALYDLGVTYSTGRGGIPVDLIEAHKWFNLAALSGDTRSQACRAEISIEMTAREIAEAQRQARSWLGAGQQRY